jgi:hypothetical protein
MEHERLSAERLSAERNRLAEQMERMAKPIVQVAHLVRQIDLCNREIGRVNATSALGLGYIPLVLSGAAPAIKALFQDAAVWDAFIAVAGLRAAPVAPGGAGAKDKQRVERLPNSQAAV